jgi:tryptophan synthase alpha chain
MSRIAGVFASAPQPRLVAYATAGDPDLDRSAAVMTALARGGADVLEVGVPFSDPIADGPVIQRASERALAAGATLESVCDLVARVRREIATPMVLFTYVNPVVRMGIEAFAARAAAAGADGVLLLDLPIEDSASVHQTLEAHGLDQIFLVSPTTTDARLAAAATYGRGFLYAISRLGVTGARQSVADTARPLVERIRRATALPVALGFGISSPAHVREFNDFAVAA